MASERPSGPIIQSGTLYRWATLCRLLGWKEHAARQARRQGFPVFTVGRGHYVLGDAALAWFARRAERERMAQEARQ